MHSLQFNVLKKKILPFAELYTEQFLDGNVDVDSISYLGRTIAKVHIMTPLLFGGKEKLLDKGLLEFLATAHYRKLMIDIGYYESHSCFKNPITGEKIPFSERAAKVIQENPEIARAVSQHFKNFTDPPIETATFVHLDLHLLNIFVKRKLNLKSMTPLSHDATMQSMLPIKLCDMEFSNWGPAGADIGLFVGSVAFYFLVHSIQGDQIYHKMDEHAITMWKSYKESYVNTAKRFGKSEQSTMRSLHYIAYESVGWAGAWLFRFSLPHLFFYYTIINVYPIEEPLKEYLKSLSSPCKSFNGLEMLRGAVNHFARAALILGFGDEVKKEFEDERVDMSSMDCDKIFFSLVEALHKSKNCLINEIMTAGNTMK